MHTKTTAFPAPAKQNDKELVLLELPAAHCNQGFAREPNAAGTHLLTWKNSDSQLLLQMGNRERILRLYHAACMRI